MEQEGRWRNVSQTQGFFFKIQDTIFMTHDHHKTESIFSIVCGVKTSMLGSVETSYVNMMIRKLSRVAS